MMPKAKYDILGKKNICFAISAALMIIGIIFNIISNSSINRKR